MVRFGDALGRRGIPHRILGLGGLLSTPEVVDVVCAPARDQRPVSRVLADPAPVGTALGDRAAGSSRTRRAGTPHRSARRRAPAALPRGRRAHPRQCRRRRRLPRGRAGLRPAAPARARLARRVHPGGPRAAARGGVGVRGLSSGGRDADPELGAADRAGAAAWTSSLRRTKHAGPPASRPPSCGPSSTRSTRSSQPTRQAHSSSLLAWQDHAEQLDEFAPRTEPPEDDVVQLLTIHGPERGSPVDAVAVVRLVKDELPSAPRDTKAWLGFGVLPLRVPRGRAVAPRAGARDPPRRSRSSRRRWTRSLEANLRLPSARRADRRLAL